jgi:hypothetical protein
MDDSATTILWNDTNEPVNIAHYGSGELERFGAALEEKRVTTQTSEALTEDDADDHFPDPRLALTPEERDEQDVPFVGPRPDRHIQGPPGPQVRVGPDVDEVIKSHAVVNGKGEVVRQEGHGGHNPMVELILAQEAGRMVESGVMPVAAPAPSPTSQEDVRKVWQDCETALLEHCQLNVMMANGPTKRQNRHVSFYGDPQTKKFHGIYLSECSDDKLHWADCDTRTLIQNVHVLPDLQHQCGLREVRNTLQTAMAELSNQVQGPVGAKP